MQEKLYKAFWQNRLWIHGLWMILMAGYIAYFAEPGNNAARILTWTAFGIGVCMVVFSPLHAKTPASKILSFAISAFAASVMLYKIIV